MAEERGLRINLGGVPVDLNAGMIEAVTNPPPGFVSKHTFTQTDLGARLKTIDWFSRCGMPLLLDLTMPMRQVGSWRDAVEICSTPEWENIEQEASNQLTVWLHNHNRDIYQSWNEVVVAQKEGVLNPLLEATIVPLQARLGLDVAVVQSLKWDILGALMENAYIRSGHTAFFFLELLLVYEAGHFPCGWSGEWPQGDLLVY